MLGTAANAIRIHALLHQLKVVLASKAISKAVVFLAPDTPLDKFRALDFEDAFLAPEVEKVASVPEHAEISIGSTEESTF